MNLFILVLTVVIVYSITFDFCILLKAKFLLEKKHREMDLISWIKVLTECSIILTLFPLYITYRKVIHKKYRDISIFKIYIDIIFLLPVLMDYTIETLVIENSKFKNPIAKPQRIKMAEILQSYFSIFNKTLDCRYTLKV